MYIKKPVENKWNLWGVDGPIGNTKDVETHETKCWGSFNNTLEALQSSRIER